jgi:hypothetical protein
VFRNTRQASRELQVTSTSSATGTAYAREKAAVQSGLSWAKELHCRGRATGAQRFAGPVIKRPACLCVS